MSEREREGGKGKKEREKKNATVIHIKIKGLFITDEGFLICFLNYGTFVLATNHYGACSVSVSRGIRDNKN